MELGILRESEREGDLKPWWLPDRLLGDSRGSWQVSGETEGSQRGLGVEGYRGRQPEKGNSKGVEVKSTCCLFKSLQCKDPCF